MPVSSGGTEEQEGVGGGPLLSVGAHRLSQEEREHSKGGNTSFGGHFAEDAVLRGVAQADIARFYHQKRREGKRGGAQGRESAL